MVPAQVKKDSIYIYMGISRYTLLFCNRLDKCHCYIVNNQSSMVHSLRVEKMHSPKFPYGRLTMQGLQHIGMVP
jgi:hypothetical protein